MKLKAFTLSALLYFGAIAVAQPASAQTLTINGTQCTYTQYTQTATANNSNASFSFTAPGCATGGGSTPSLGTAQFTASTYNSALQGTSRDVSVQRDGHIPGVANSLSGSVVVDAGSSGNCSIASPNFTFTDGDTGTKTIAVTAANAGSCNLSLNMSTGSSSGRTTASFTVTPANAIAFAAGTSTTTPSQNTSLVVNRTDAGGSATAITVDYSCGLSGFSDNSNRTGQLGFTNAANSSQNITLAVPSLSGAGNGTITCTLSNAAPNGTIVNSPTRNAPEHVVTVTPPTAPTCAPTASPNQFTAGSNQNVVLNSACSANTNAGTTYTWSRTPTNTTGPNVTSASGVQSGANFLAAATAGSYGYRLVACNGGVCTGNLDVTVTVNPPVDANCYVFDAPEPSGNPVVYDIAIAKDRTSSMRLPKSRLANFLFHNFDAFMVFQVTDQPCAPNMVDPATLPLPSDVPRATCQFSVYFSTQTVYLWPQPSCTLPTVPDGGSYYINMRPAQPNAQGSALTLTTPTRTDICNGTLPTGGAACLYRLNF